MFAALSAVAVLMAAAVWQWWRLERGCQQWARQARRLAIRAYEAELRWLYQRRIADVQRRTESVVEFTNSAVRSLHKGIARIPFSLLKRLPETRATAVLVERLHDTTSDAVYDSVSAVNRLVGSQVRRGIGVGRQSVGQVSPDGEPEER